MVSKLNNPVPGGTKWRGSDSLGIELFANFGPTVEKNSLNSFAIFSSPVTMLPFTVISLMLVLLEYNRIR